MAGMLTPEALEEMRRERLARLHASGVPIYAIAYRLNNRLGMTTPEPAEGAMCDRNVLIGIGATDIEVVEVKV